MLCAGNVHFNASVLQLHKHSKIFALTIGLSFMHDQWCYFYCSLGGERPRFTAARECYEETLGILGNTKELAAALKDFKTNNCFKVLSYCDMVFAIVCVMFTLNFLFLRY